MQAENPRWGSMRILGELKKLGYDVSNSNQQLPDGSLRPLPIAQLASISCRGLKESTDNGNGGFLVARPSWAPRND